MLMKYNNSDSSLNFEPLAAAPAAIREDGHAAVPPACPSHAARQAPPAGASGGYTTTLPTTEGVISQTLHP